MANAKDRLGEANMTGEAITLNGCAPTPLASYLKALGVLRLISSPANHVSGEAADPHARGWWEGRMLPHPDNAEPRSTADLLSPRLCAESDHRAVEWRQRFLSEGQQGWFNPLVETPVAVRFERLSSVIRCASDMVADRGFSVRPEKLAKVDFVASLRSELPDNALPWLDATLALSGDGLTYPQLLGTGGNDDVSISPTILLADSSLKRKLPGLFDASTGKTIKGCRSASGQRPFRYGGTGT